MSSQRSLRESKLPFIPQGLPHQTRVLCIAPQSMSTSAQPETAFVAAAVTEQAQLVSAESILQSQDSKEASTPLSPPSVTDPAIAQPSPPFIKQQQRRLLPRVYVEVPPRKASMSALSHVPGATQQRRPRVVSNRWISKIYTDDPIYRMRKYQMTRAALRKTGRPV